jgi:hypothetical protein
MDCSEANFQVETSAERLETTTKSLCTNRESNPGPKHGKLGCYHYTIGARAVRKHVFHWMLWRTAYVEMRECQLWGSNPCAVTCSGS